MGTAYYSSTRFTNPYVDALADGYRWQSGDTVTFYLDGTGTRTDGVPASWQTDGAGAAIQTAAASWNAVANIHYALTNSRSSADYLETLYSDTGTDDGSVTLGEHYYPNGQQLGGKYNTGSGYFTAADIAKGGLFYETFIHELGHGLGLDHPFDGDQVFPGVTSGDSDSTGDNDLNSQLYTVMTYNDVSDLSGDAGTDSYGNAETPMAFDIAAVQAIYGANMTTATGNDTYKLVSHNGAGTGYTCIWDAGGVDTISGAGLTTSCTIDLRAATLDDAPGGGGYLSRDTGIYGGFTIAHGVTIENAIGGTGSDTLTGNDADNLLDGGAGHNTLTGGAGKDTFVIDPNSSDDIQDFQSGIDLLDVASTGAVSAYIQGYSDIYEVDLDAASGSQVATFNSALPSLSDLNGLAVTYDIAVPAGLVSFAGGAGNDSLTGDATIGSLSGGDGNDTLLSDGGHLLGNAGDDTIQVDDDRSASANGGAGSDLIEVVRSPQVGVYSFQGSSLSGADGQDILVGGGGADQLDGGAGADTMSGGAGNDTYVVDDAHDKVSEGSGAGTDTIEASVSWRLEDNVENLTLMGGATVGKGNALANVLIADDVGDSLYGYDGADRLIGGKGADHLTGGTGADTMQGYAGNDTYVVDNAHDVVSEDANAGTDTVVTSVSWRLEDNVENLTLTGAATVGKGNALANTLTGDDLANTLSGYDGDDVITGGLGRDTLSGGAGHDRFVFTNAADFASATGSKADEITDFSAGDRIDLSKLDARAGGNDDAFTWLGTADYDGHAGEVRMFEKGGATYIQGDLDGDKLSDFALKLDGLHALTAADFVL